MMTKGEMNADPIEGEFFSTERLDNMADALVRESIQNSLDAGLPGQTVRVAFRLFTKNPDLNRGMSHYLKDLEPHLNAEQNGLSKAPLLRGPETFLTIEDYGTRGLEGDPAQDDDFQPADRLEKNDFFYFWRNVGRSRKSDTDRGRWGLGKTVFQATSQINSFFGLTVRQIDGRSLLMGQSVLKTHVANGRKHSPYGWYGFFDENFALPIEDKAYLEKFSSRFGLRRLGEAGLSIVIPYPDPSVEIKTLLSSTLFHYFFPILSKDLVIELHRDGESLIIDDQKIDELLNAEFSKSRLTKEHFQRLFNFTRWIHSLSPDALVKLNPPPGQSAPKWDETLFDPAVLSKLRERFDHKERLAIRVPLQIKSKDRVPEETHFDIFMERDDQLDKAEEHFIREGITIAGVGALKQKGIRTVVSINDKVLSAFLGDSENPSHTEWQERSPKFRGQYTHGASCLRFVKNSPREIVRFLSKPALGIDKKLLEDFFSVEPPSDKGHEGTSGGDQKTPKGESPVPPELVGQSKEFRLLRKQGGFRISMSPKTASLPNAALVTVAYETRGRNPFSKYSPFDFEVDKAPIKVKNLGARIRAKIKNQLIIQIEKPDFSVEVTGFDLRRDLRVKAEPVEP